MSKRDVFVKLLADAVSDRYKHVVARDIHIPLDTLKIISIIGPRRSGKTHLLYSLINELRQTVPPEHTIYLSCEDDRLYPLVLADMDDFIETYYEQYPKARDSVVYFFFDEIQEITHWEKFIRRIYDREKCRIFITGSSAKLLSREIGTALRGRSLAYELMPLSFNEFLKFQQIEIRSPTSKSVSNLRHQLMRYMKQGGFPELFFNPKEIHQKIIQEHLDVLLYKDVAERFGVTNTAALKYLLKYYCQNIGNRISVSKVFHIFKSQGYAISKHTLYQYVDHLEEVYAIFRISIYSTSIKKQARHPDKIYAADAMYRHVTTVSEAWGNVLENIMYLHYRRVGETIHFYAGNHEVDFVLGPQHDLVNVCYDWNAESTRQREILGLEEGMHIFKKKKSLLVTWDSETLIETSTGTITVQPAWKVLSGMRIS